MLVKGKVCQIVFKEKVPWFALPSNWETDQPSKSSILLYDYDASDEKGNDLSSGNLSQHSVKEGNKGGTFFFNENSTHHDDESLVKEGDSLGNSCGSEVDVNPGKEASKETIIAESDLVDIRSGVDLEVIPDKLCDGDLSKNAL